MNFRPMGLLVGLLTGFVLCAVGSPVRAAGSFISVDGRRVGVVLIPEKPAIMLGEPAAVLFTLHNYSDEALQVMEGGDYRNALGRQDSFKVTVHGAGGTPVPQPEAGMGMGGISGPRDIPAGSSYSFRLFLPHWARFSTPGTYSMVAKRELQFLKVKERGLSPGNMVSVDAQAGTTIEVVPADRDAMGRIIDDIGSKLLADRSDDWPDSPAVRLAAIQDERVIPWFAKAFATNSYEQKFAALSALAKFGNDEAFAILKMGMDTRGVDIENATTPEPAHQLADNIRHGAAVALSRSPCPGAKAFLISRRNDSSMGVRITILHVLGQMPRAEALPILEEMSHDQDARVRNEAKRYVALLTAKK